MLCRSVDPLHLLQIRIPYINQSVSLAALLGFAAAKPFRLIVSNVLFGEATADVASPVRAFGFAALDRSDNGTASVVVEHALASEAQDLFRPLFALLHHRRRVVLSHNVPLVGDLRYADAYAAARSSGRACTGRWWRRAALLDGAASLGLLSIHIEGHLLRHDWCRPRSSDDRHNLLG